MNDYITNAFTRQNNKTNLEVNNLNVDCITSTNNNFELDSDGNLSVKSITTEQGGSSGNSLTEIMNAIYPVGAIYMSVSNTNPGAVFGGTWEQIKDRFLLCCGDSYSNGQIGGEATHLLTQAESGLREHTHQMPLSSNEGVNNETDVPYRGYCPGNYSGVDSNFRTGRVTAINNRLCDYEAGFVTGTTDANAIVPHNNMPPYLAVYTWKRIQ